jgi:hypothetical protein
MIQGKHSSKSITKVDEKQTVTLCIIYTGKK